MNTKQFWYLMLSILVFLLCLKIYQHNCVVQLTYDKQKLEQKKITLEKEKDRLLVELYHSKQQNTIAHRAQKKLGMKPLSVSQVIKMSAHIN